MKKFIFAIAAILAVTMMFSACGKKDEQPSEPVSQTQDTATDEKATNESMEENKEETPDKEEKKESETKEEKKETEKAPEKEADKEPVKEEKAEEPKEEAAPITNEDGEPVTSEDFENLVDTFNNADDEQAKEEARKQLESILKQAEANAQ